MSPREKFEGEAVETAKLRLRQEEVYAEAETCPACAAARTGSGDPTALCQRHLAAVLAAS